MRIMKRSGGTLPKTNSSPLKTGHPKRKLIFQPSIFRGHVSFREGRSFFLLLCLWRFSFFFQKVSGCLGSQFFHQFFQFLALWMMPWCSKYPVRRCSGTQNPLQNHLQKGLEHKGWKKVMVTFGLAWIDHKNLAAGENKLFPAFSSPESNTKCIT